MREERKQSENSLGDYVQPVWSGAGLGPFQLSRNKWSGEVERSIAPSGGAGGARDGGAGGAWVRCSR